jgi:hypothetical protein
MALPLIRSALLVCVVAMGAGVLFLIGIVVAPEVDERVGFFTARAMRAVQSYQSDGMPLRRIVDEQFQSVRWRTYHQDIPFQTFVECVGIPRSGGPEKRLVWYVEERLEWNYGPSFKITVMTALNGDALRLTPHLFDHRAGFGLEQWRHGTELP